MWSVRCFRSPGVALPWLAGAVAAFLLGRHVARHSVDFIVYYRAARSLLAGRTDLYSRSFSWGPPMTYIYPPLFLLLVFPLGWLSFANAFGVWFALMTLATAAVVRLAYRQWRPEGRLKYFWLLAVLPGPYLVWTLVYGNAEVFIVLLTILAVLAWAQGRLWRSSFALALGGAIKVFPLFLVSAILVRREWGLAARVAGVSCVLWLLPAVYFGPLRAAALYRSWYRTVVRDSQEYREQRGPDLSLPGVMERWFTHVDYSHYRDRNYPQVNILNLTEPVLKGLVIVVDAVILALSLRLCARSRTTEASLRGVSSREWEAGVAIAACIVIAAQILVGPYTTFLYPSGWLLVALALPLVTQGSTHLTKSFLALGTLNTLLFGIPGSRNQRALWAWGAFAVVGLLLWVLVMYSGRMFAQAKRQA
jgi:hypothetical protein